MDSLTLLTLTVLVVAASILCVTSAFADDVFFDTKFVFPPQNTPDSNYQTSRGSGVAMVGDYQGALRFYDDALSQDPYHVIATGNKAVAYYELDRLEESLTWIEKTLALDPNYPQALNNKGWFLIQDEKPEEALVLFEKALKIKPDYQLAEKNKIATLIELGQYTPEVISDSGGPVSFLNYENSDMGFRVDYPSSWEVDDSLFSLVYFLSPFEGQTDDFMDNAVVVTEYLNEPITLEEYFDLVIKYQEVSGATVEEIKSTSLANNPAMQATVTIEIEGQKLEQTSIFTIKDDVVYSVTLTTDSKSTSKFVSTFGMIVDSFEILSASENTGQEVRGLIAEINDLYDQGLLQEALAKTETVLSIQPNHYDALLLKGGILVDLGKNIEAERVADQILELSEFDPGGLMMKGLSLYGQGKFQGAIEYFDEYLYGFPTDPFVLSLKGIALAESGNREEAISVIDKAIEVDPSLGFSQYAKGYYFYLYKDYDQAIFYYDKALKLEPGDPIYLNDKGVALLDQGQMELAEVIFDQILLDHPNSSLAMNNKGLILADRGENSEALKYFDMALELEPDNVLFLQNKIAILSSLGIPGLAELAYNQILQLDPDYDVPLEDIKTPSTTLEQPEPVQESTEIPNWVRNNADWWSEGVIGDSDFVSGIQYLIKEGIMTIPETKQGIISDSQEIPSWVKNNADWWAQGLITDDDFIKGIQFLIENGIMVV